MFKTQRAWLAQRSFDYQWEQLPDGAGLLTDRTFAKEVDDIISMQELRIDKAWFAGKRVLDAGCGNGRWIEGFLRLGCVVTAFDASRHALDHVSAQYGDNLEIVQGDLLKIGSVLAGRTFDLVWCWGVVHHTSNARSAVTALTKLVAPAGLIYLYVYGRDSVTQRGALRLAIVRFVLNLMPLRARKRLISRIWGKDLAHGKFDLLSTPLNDRFTLAEVTAWLSAAGFTHVVQTMPHTEVLVRADRGASSADSLLLPEPPRPYWFERIAR